MARIAMLLGKDTFGNFVNPVTGESLTCVAEGNDVQGLIDKYCDLRGKKSVTIKKGKKEIKLEQVFLPATNTAGGMLKAKLRFEA